MSLITQELNTSGTDRLSPLLQTQQAITDLNCGEILMINASNPGMLAELDAFCQQTGNELLEHLEWDGEFTVLIRKFCQ
ncbi:MAG: sulfurtransferase TusA family protein [Acidiferrobacterales bacterium]